MKFFLVVSFALLTLCSAALLSKRNYVPHRWEMGERADPNVPHYFRIFLTQRNQDQLTEVFNAVSDPDSPQYGQFWSIDQILDLVAPPREDHDLVITWLLKNGVSMANIQSFRDSLKIVAPVHVVETLLNTKLYQFTRDGTTINRQWGPAEVPDQIIDLIDIIVGVDDFYPAPKTLRKRSIKKPSPESVGYVVPSVIRNVYNLPDSYEVSTKSSICLAEFQSDNSFDKSDLSYFEQQTLSPTTNVDSSHIIGPYAPQPPDAESTLDVQYATAVGLNTTMWFWTTTGWMLDFAQDFFNRKDVPLIVSMSWGWTESAQCQIVNCQGSSQDYVQRVNEEFKKIGTRGVSLFAASGDQGAPGDGDAYCDNFQDPLSSIFPGASPYVTAVGATMLVGNSETENVKTGATPPICNQYQCATSRQEAVCTYPTALITTGGGFSAYSPRPAWQDTAVKAYLSSNVTLPPSTYFQKNNRGFPDVSALGHNYVIYISGGYEVVDGTSCSSPVFAAIFSHLNDIRLNSGKPPLGFAAPLLYKIWESDKTSYHDIASGNNKCTESCCDQYGYEATVGWDAATGLGSPDFPKLKKFVEALN